MDPLIVIRSIVLFLSSSVCPRADSRNIRSCVNLETSNMTSYRSHSRFTTLSQPQYVPSDRLRLYHSRRRALPARSGTKHLGRMLSEPQVLGWLHHSLAASLTSPTFSLGPYFSITLAPWYFQNCLVASLPTILFRILGPPGCSSMNSGINGQKHTAMQRSSRGRRTCDIVDAGVDDDPHATGLVLVLSDLGGGVLLGHLVCVLEMAKVMMVVSA